MNGQAWEQSLKEWHSGLQPDDTARRRIMRNVRDNFAAGSIAVPYNVRTDLFWMKLRYTLAGAMVAFMVAWLNFAWPQEKDGLQTGNGPAESFASISEERAGFGYQLFRDFEEQFAKRLRWVSTSRGYVGVGVCDELPRLDDPGKPVLVRMVVVQGNAARDWWRPVWYADVIVRNGEVAEVIPNEQDENRLKLLVYRRADGLFTVGTRVVLDSPLQLSASDVRPVIINEPTALVLPSSKDNDYKLLYAIQPLLNGDDQS